jgi:hypothetical protein
MTESLAQKLKLPRSATSVSVYGVGGKLTAVARNSVAFKISPRDPRDGGSTVSVSALILPQITIYNSGIRADGGAWSHLDDIDLANPDILAADLIELFFGAAVYADILLPGLRRGRPREPVA